MHNQARTIAVFSNLLGRAMAPLKATVAMPEESVFASHGRPEREKISSCVIADTGPRVFIEEPEGITRLRLKAREPGPELNGVS